MWNLEFAVCYNRESFGNDLSHLEIVNTLIWGGIFEGVFLRIPYVVGFQGALNLSFGWRGKWVEQQYM